MKPVRNLVCPGCKNHWFVGYDGEAGVLYCYDCAQKRAMESFGLSEKLNPADLPTPMFENVLDEMDRLMGREPPPRARFFMQAKPTPPPTTEWIKPSKAEGWALFYLGIMAVLSFGFILGFLVRNAQ